MKTWITEMQVINQNTKEPVWVSGMKVVAPTLEMAQQILDKYDYHYLVISGELICEIPCKPGTNDPDWEKMIDFESIVNN